MSKLTFRYGCVNSAKTLVLLTVAHNYEFQNKEIIVAKPTYDTRYGKDLIVSRAGPRRPADILITDKHDLTRSIIGHPKCILVDEAQFLHPDVIDRLRHISAVWDVPVICYGLRSDFRGKLFDGSRRLLEVADKIEEIKTVCTMCDNKATMNLKLVDGEPTLDGPSIELGGVEKFIPVCWKCWVEKTDKRKEEERDDSIHRTGAAEQERPPE